MTAKARTVTRVGGPWTHRTEAAQLPRLYPDDPPCTDEIPAIDHTVAPGELEDLALRAIHDDRALAVLMSRPETLRRVLELMARYDAQADWFCALAERQLGTVERLQAEVAAERGESLRLQQLNALRCAELAETRTALLQMSAQVAIAGGVPGIPPARDDFGGDTESYPADVARGEDP